MAVKSRNGHWYIYFYPFKVKKIGLKTDARTKNDAKHIEAMILKACRTGSYESLDLDSRYACIRMFENQGWELPSDLRVEARPREELTLWKACELFLKDSEIKSSQNAWRYMSAIDHLVDKLGEDKPIKLIWSPEIKTYREQRLEEGGAPATVNREVSTLSRIFGVLIDHRLLEDNPVHLVHRLSEKSGQRQVYLSLQDVEKIMEQCPAWFRPIIAIAYYTGMRRGEILSLRRKQVNLSKRMIYLGPQDTKEGHFKRVPIPHDLVPYLEGCLKVQSIGTDRLFLIDGRPPSFESLKNPWRKACEALGLNNPRPRFHDLRHTWRANARRNNMDPAIAESIMGHWFKEKSVNNRYGRISDEELIRAVDSMTFDNGDTEIIVASG
jgi:integrase